MHAIVQGHLKAFVDEHNFAKEKESRQFEAFSVHCVAQRYDLEPFDLEEVLTADGTEAIDGFFLLLDGELLISASELADRLGASKRKDHEVRFVLVQSKTSDGFCAADIAHVGSFIYGTVTDSATVTDERLLDFVASRALVNKHIGRLRDGRPRVRSGRVKSQRKCADSLERKSLDGPCAFLGMGPLPDCSKGRHDDPTESAEIPLAKDRSDAAVDGGHGQAWAGLVLANRVRGAERRARG